MLYAITVLVFFTVLLISSWILTILNKDKLSIESRINAIGRLDNKGIVAEMDYNEALPFAERIIIPFYKAVIDTYLRVTPQYKMDSLTKELDRAGLNKKFTANQWVFRRILVSAIVSVLFLYLAIQVQMDYLRTLFFFVLAILFTNFAFKFYLSKRVAARKNNILKALPFTLDLITLGVEAGLSFDDSIVTIADNSSGDLTDEFIKTLKEMRMGLEKKHALRNMSDRCEVKELTTFLTALIQADELGVGLGKVMRIESNTLRSTLKEVSRERAMKAPIKMLFPLIFLIFPSIFIIILGPAIIRVMEML